MNISARLGVLKQPLCLHLNKMTGPCLNKTFLPDSLLSFIIVTRTDDDKKNHFSSVARGSEAQGASRKIAPFL